LLVRSQIIIKTTGRLCNNWKQANKCDLFEVQEFLIPLAK
jgi:hypothetical protein